MIRFVIGLGNPEPRYAQTPHNLGLRLVESIQEARAYAWKKDRTFDRTDSDPAYVRLHTYMNLSGEAVSALLKKFDAKPGEILVCYDDFDLPAGSIRIRKQGSAGSHNGLKSVVECLQTSDFPRLRLGIGPLPAQADPAAYVLAPFPKSQREAVDAMLARARDAVEAVLQEGLDSAMNRFNSGV